VNYTPKQLEIMNFIRDYRRERGTAPTLEEIGQHLGIHRVTVHQHVGALVKKGAVQKLAQRSRSIEILDKDFLPRPSIPLLGRIAAGKPLEAIEESEQFTLEDLLPVDLQSKGFLLRVQGDSMIEDHIADGDLVIVEPRNAARDGEIVVAIVDGEATLKRLYREGDAVRLQPANSRMAPIMVRPPQRFEIRGVVKGVIRRYD
jgi:repressor LexA